VKCLFLSFVVISAHAPHRKGTTLYTSMVGQLCLCLYDVLVGIDANTTFNSRSGATNSVGTVGKARTQSPHATEVLAKSNQMESNCWTSTHEGFCISEFILNPNPFCKKGSKNFCTIDYIFNTFSISVKKRPLMYCMKCVLPRGAWIMFPWLPRPCLTPQVVNNSTSGDVC